MFPVEWKEYFSTQCIYCSENFWQSIDVWVLKPHVLNNNISATNVFAVRKLNYIQINEFLNYLKINFSKLNSEVVKRDLVNLILSFNKIIEGVESDFSNDVSLRLLYPKTGRCSLENIDVIIKDLKCLQITFIKPVEVSSSISPITVPYSLCLKNESLKLLIPKDTTENNSLNWLATVLLSKLVDWMKPRFCKEPTYSHKLIEADKYIAVFNKLKEKYYKSIQEIWTESTNPQKFIIEDIAIASYLLVLWDSKPQRYVDLGCGNGLLVHILNSEQHLGLGLDVRARKIWNLYPKTTVLKESTITPSLECRFPNVDWILGNHSDELTPWIPVIAANSGHKTNFFLLPCCLFDFDGSKYARTCSKQSCYEEYMEYIKRICNICGFIIDKDRLKIPSTKRNCFVSFGRMYSEGQEPLYNEKICTFVKNKIEFGKQIKVRVYEERVKNCTQLDKQFLAKVVYKVAKFLISTSKDNNSWREGEYIDLKDIAKLLSLDDRQKLKNECGGLQTLLKNHHDIFLVSGGKVKLRKPSKRTVPSHLTKRKDCWFFINHPDSCPLSNDQCTYIHPPEDNSSVSSEPE